MAARVVLDAACGDIKDAPESADLARLAPLGRLVLRSQGVVGAMGLALVAWLDGGGALDCASEDKSRD